MLSYLLQGFGFKSSSDFLESTFTVVVHPAFKKTAVSASLIIATLITWLENTTGVDVTVLVFFVYLICAEFQTGLKVAMMKNGERFKSRKFGRMIVKIGVYVMIVIMLHNFAERFTIPNLLGFEVSPFIWLYYTVFIMVIFQLLISYLENLSSLGYREMKGIVGFVLRKYNKWFEFDGTKDGDSFQ